MRIHKDFLRGQLDGNMLTLRLCNAIRHPGPLDVDELLPDLGKQSNAYRSGLKAVVTEKIFPEIISMFHETPRSSRERLKFMDDILRHLR